MFELERWQEIFETIGKNKLRTFLTGLSVASGIFILVILLGIGEGMRNGISKEFEQDAANILYIWTGVTTKGYKGLNPGRMITLKNDDYDQVVSEHDDELEYKSSIFRIWGGLVNYKKESGSYRVEGAWPDYQFLENASIVSGRYINYKDHKNFEKVVVLGNKVKTDLFKDGEDPLGKYVQISDINFKVIGVFSDPGGEREETRVFLPISTAQRVFGGGTDIRNLAFTLTKEESFEEALAASEKFSAELESYLKAKHTIAPDDTSAVSINNSLENAKRFYNLMDMIKFFFWGVGICTIVAGVVGVSNIMLIIVKERTKEIGIRKALGAEPISIIGMVLHESIFVTAIAGFIGLIFSLALLEFLGPLIETEYIANPSIDFNVAITTVFILVFAGALAGFFPAWRAARIKPIIALETNNMFSKDNWSEIIEALSSNWFRTLLTAFGVLWGIFILVILLAAGKGLENGVKQGFGGMATNSMFMWSQTPSKPYKGLPKGRRYNFKTGDVAAIRDNISDLRFVSPRNQLGGFGGANNVVRGLKTGAFNVYGDYPEIIQQDPMDITSGRFINYSDINEKRKVAIIGDGIRKDLYEPGEEIIGSYLKINGVNFMVIGSYKKKGNNGNAEEGQKEIFVPFTAFSQAFNMGETVGWMAITANDNSSITELKHQVFDIIKSRHSIHPEDDRAIGNFDLYEEFSKINGLFIALKAIAYFVGILVLLSGIIGISNIMLIVVKERTNEIGVRRALGATPWSIRGQIILESIFLTIVSGMAGIAMATGVIALINFKLEGVDTSEMMFTNPSVDLGVVFTALSILIISGLLAGLIPAQNAIKVQPVDALRTE